MQLPEGLSEAEVMAAVEKVVRGLSKGFAFGIYSREDIEQEGRIEALRVLPKYDGRRPLESFLHRCVKNRLIRLKRDKLTRTDPPCRGCHEAAEHEPWPGCKAYLAWKKRNEAKAGLMSPLELTDGVAVEDDPQEHALHKEVLHKIDLELDVSLRPTYLKMRAGESVPRERRAEVEAAIKDILSGEI